MREHAPGLDQDKRRVSVQLDNQCLDWTSMYFCFHASQTQCVNASCSQAEREGEKNKAGEVENNNTKKKHTL